MRSIYKTLLTRWRREYLAEHHMMVLLLVRLRLIQLEIQFQTGSTLKLNVKSQSLITRTFLMISSNKGMKTKSSTKLTMKKLSKN